MSQEVTTTKNGGIWTVTLDRPKANAIALTTSKSWAAISRPSAMTQRRGCVSSKQRAKNSSPLVGI